MASRQTPLAEDVAALAPSLGASQHGPRPLPLFLSLALSETGGSPERLARVMAGLAAYQEAPRPVRPPAMPCVARSGRARLTDYGSGDAGGLPVVFVPSLINAPLVLDLTERNSLLRWLATQPGMRPMLVEWGWPGAGEHARDIGGHVVELLLPLIDSLPRPPVLAGYCLGGTMALAAAMLRPVAGLALIATPWRFSGFPATARDDLAALWQSARHGAESSGLLPMEVLQSAFWRLDPQRTIAKYERFAGLDRAGEEAQRFVALEDWANGGAPLTLGAGRELFEDMFAHDLPGSGTWRVGGAVVDPARLACPAIDIVSLSDRIVPAASAAGLSDRRALDAGHVGMIVGSRARAELWQPLADWLSAVTKQC